MLIARYGLGMVAAGCFLEGETFALTAGLLQHRGLLPFWPTVLAVAAGGWAWDLVIFGSGRAFRTHPRIARALAHPRAQRVTRRLLGRPALLAAVFRFIPGSRTVAPLALTTGTPLRAAAYAAITFVSACVWGLAMVAIGQDIGRAVEALWGRIQDVRWFLVLPVLSLAGFAAWTILRWRRRS